jgi:hypothetical protein
MLLGYGSGFGYARFLKSQDPDMAGKAMYKKYNNILIFLINNLSYL